MRSFLLGVLTILIIVVISYISINESLFITLSLIVGGLSLLFAGVFSGSFISGNRGRANYLDEDDFRRRHKWAFNLFLFGLPYIIGVIIYYYYF